MPECKPPRNDDLTDNDFEMIEMYDDHTGLPIKMRGMREQPAFNAPPTEGMADSCAALDELSKAKRALESRLQSMISIELSAFRALTGVSVDRLSVDIVEVTTITDKRRQYVSGAVEVSIPLA